MDAYLFARTATDEAVADLRRRAAPTGPIRVVCPLDGDRELYVALTAPDEDSLTSAITDVSSTDGLTEPTPYVVIPGVGEAGVNPPDAQYPTYCEVEAFVGFAMLTVPEGFAGPPLGAEGVVGVAIVRRPDGRGLLVEVTAGNENDTRARLAGLEGFDGTQLSFRAVGRAADGAGFVTE